MFDSGVEWRGGPYALMWIDLPDSVFVARDEGKGSWTPKVEQQVFAVAWNGRYLVAQQHPKGDKKITNYFIVDSQKDSPHATPNDSVIGPLSEAEFKNKSQELGLPQFTKVLASLR
jgi:hypothetical protein